MLFLSDGYYEVDPGMLAKRDMADSCHWNLWKIRMRPFNEIEDGTGIVLVDSWPGGGRLTWEIAATEVLAKPYSSKRSAVRMIASTVGWSERDVRAHPYTSDHPQNGYVLAFRYRPIRSIGRPRPKDLRLLQHGWTKVEDARTLKRWRLAAGSK